MNLLIKGGQILDGLGNPPYKADILISGNKISAIGDFSHRSAQETILTNGSYISPGFIEIRNEADHYLTLFNESHQKKMIEQGITTIIGGFNGCSLSPLIYGDLNIFNQWQDSENININWHSLKEMFNSFKKFPLAINFGTVIGYYTIRRDITLNRRELSEKELEIFSKIIEKSFKEGAFGLSSGLDYSFGYQIPFKEKQIILNLLKKFRKFFAIQPMERKQNPLQVAEEAVEIVKNGVSVIINDFQPVIGCENEYQKALELISLNLTKADIRFDICPYGINVVSLSDFLPQWFKKKGKEGIFNKEKLTAKGQFTTKGRLTVKERLKKEWKNLDFEKIIILNIPKFNYLTGKNILEFSENRGLDEIEGLIELAKLSLNHEINSSGRPLAINGTIGIKNINEELLEKNLMHRQSFISSNFTSLKEEERLPFSREGAFMKFLGFSFVDDQKTALLPIESAIKKITSEPAKFLSLKDRGVIKEGNVADLTIFKEKKIQNVIISGKLAVKEGEFQNIFNGKTLKHYTR